MSSAAAAASPAAPPPFPSPVPPECQLCDERSPTSWCPECELFLCEQDNSEYHQQGHRKGHARVQLAEAATKEPQGEKEKEEPENVATPAPTATPGQFAAFSPPSTAPAAPLSSAVSTAVPSTHAEHVSKEGVPSPRTSNDPSSTTVAASPSVAFTGKPAAAAAATAVAAAVAARVPSSSAATSPPNPKLSATAPIAEEDEIEESYDDEAFEEEAVVELEEEQEGGPGGSGTKGKAGKKQKQKQQQEDDIEVDEEEGEASPGETKRAPRPASKTPTVTATDPKAASTNAPPPVAAATPSDLPAAASAPTAKDPLRRSSATKPLVTSDAAASATPPTVTRSTEGSDSGSGSRRGSASASATKDDRGEENHAATSKDKGAASPPAKASASSTSGEGKAEPAAPTVEATPAVAVADEPKAAAPVALAEKPVAEKPVESVSKRATDESTLSKPADKTAPSTADMTAASAPRSDESPAAAPAAKATEEGKAPAKDDDQLAPLPKFVVPPRARAAPRRSANPSVARPPASSDSEDDPFASPPASTAVANDSSPPHSAALPPAAMSAAVAAAASPATPAAAAAAPSPTPSEEDPFGNSPPKLTAAAATAAAASSTSKRAFSSSSPTAAATTGLSILQQPPPARASPSPTPSEDPFGSDGDEPAPLAATTKQRSVPAASASGSALPSAASSAASSPATAPLVAARGPVAAPVDSDSDDPFASSRDGSPEKSQHRQGSDGAAPSVVTSPALKAQGRRDADPFAEGSPAASPATSPTLAPAVPTPRSDEDNEEEIKEEGESAPVPAPVAARKPVREEESDDDPFGDGGDEVPPSERATAASPVSPSPPSPSPPPATTTAADVEEDEEEEDPFASSDLSDASPPLKPATRPSLPLAARHDAAAKELSRPRPSVTAVQERVDEDEDTEEDPFAESEDAIAADSSPHPPARSDCAPAIPISAPASDRSDRSDRSLSRAQKARPASPAASDTGSDPFASAPPTPHSPPSSSFLSAAFSARSATAGGSGDLDDPFSLSTASTPRDLMDDEPLLDLEEHERERDGAFQAAQRFGGGGGKVPRLDDSARLFGETPPTLDSDPLSSLRTPPLSLRQFLPPRPVLPFPARLPGDACSMCLLDRATLFCLDCNLAVCVARGCDAELHRAELGFHERVGYESVKGKLGPMEAKKKEQQEEEEEEDDPFLEPAARGESSMPRLRPRPAVSTVPSLAFGNSTSTTSLSIPAFTPQTRCHACTLRASVYCLDCGVFLCDATGGGKGCDAKLHSSRKEGGEAFQVHHRRTLKDDRRIFDPDTELDSSRSSTSTSSSALDCSPDRTYSTSLLCEVCRTSPSAVQCGSCGMNFCRACDREWHEAEEMFRRHRREGMEPQGQGEGDVEGERRRRREEAAREDERRRIQLGEKKKQTSASSPSSPASEEEEEETDRELDAMLARRTGGASAPRSSPPKPVVRGPRDDDDDDDDDPFASSSAVSSARSSRSHSPTTPSAPAVLSSPAPAPVAARPTDPLSATDARCSQCGGAADVWCGDCGAYFCAHPANGIGAVDKDKAGGATLGAKKGRNVPRSSPPPPATGVRHKDTQEEDDDAVDSDSSSPSSSHPSPLGLLDRSAASHNNCDLHFHSLASKRLHVRQALPRHARDVLAMERHVSEQSAASKAAMDARMEARAAARARDEAERKRQQDARAHSKAARRAAKANATLESLSRESALQARSKAEHDEFIARARQLIRSTDEARLAQERRVAEQTAQREADLLAQMGRVERALAEEREAKRLDILDATREASYRAEAAWRDRIANERKRILAEMEQARRDEAAKQARAEEKLERLADQARHIGRSEQIHAVLSAKDLRERKAEALVQAKLEREAAESALKARRAQKELERESILDGLVKAREERREARMAEWEERERAEAKAALERKKVREQVRREALAKQAAADAAEPAGDKFLPSGSKSGSEAQARIAKLVAAREKREAERLLGTGGGRKKKLSSKDKATLAGLAAKERMGRSVISEDEEVDEEDEAGGDTKPNAQPTASPRSVRTPRSARKAPPPTTASQRRDVSNPSSDSEDDPFSSKPAKFVPPNRAVSGVRSSGAPPAPAATKGQKGGSDSDEESSDATRKPKPAHGKPEKAAAASSAPRSPRFPTAPVARRPPVHAADHTKAWGAGKKTELLGRTLPAPKELALQTEREKAAAEADRARKEAEKERRAAERKERIKELTGAPERAQQALAAATAKIAAAAAAASASASAPKRPSSSARQGPEEQKEPSTAPDEGTPAPVVYAAKRNAAVVRSSGAPAERKKTPAAPATVAAPDTDSGSDIGEESGLPTAAAVSVSDQHGGSESDDPFASSLDSVFASGQGTSKPKPAPLKPSSKPKPKQAEEEEKERGVEAEDDDEDEDDDGKPRFVRLRLDCDYSAPPGGRLPMFQKLLLADLTQALAAPPTQLRVVSLRAGSIEAVLRVGGPGAGRVVRELVRQVNEDSGKVGKIWGGKVTKHAIEGSAKEIGEAEASSSTGAKDDAAAAVGAAASSSTHTEKDEEKNTPTPKPAVLIKLGQSPLPDLRPAHQRTSSLGKEALLLATMTPTTPSSRRTPSGKFGGTVRIETKQEQQEEAAAADESDDPFGASSDGDSPSPADSSSAADADPIGGSTNFGATMRLPLGKTFKDFTVPPVSLSAQPPVQEVAEPDTERSVRSHGRANGDWSEEEDTEVPDDMEASAEELPLKKKQPPAPSLSSSRSRSRSNQSRHSHRDEHDDDDKHDDDHHHVRDESSSPARSSRRNDPSHAHSTGRSGRSVSPGMKPKSSSFRVPPEALGHQKAKRAPPLREEEFEDEAELAKLWPALHKMKEAVAPHTQAARKKLGATVRIESPTAASAATAAGREKERSFSSTNAHVSVEGSSTISSRRPRPPSAGPVRPSSAAGARPSSARIHASVAEATEPAARAGAAAKSKSSTGALASTAGTGSAAAPEAEEEDFSDLQWEALRSSTLPPRKSYAIKAREVVLPLHKRVDADLARREAAIQAKLGLATPEQLELLATAPVVVTSPPANVRMKQAVMAATSVHGGGGGGRKSMGSTMSAAVAAFSSGASGGVGAARRNSTTAAASNAPNGHTTTDKAPMSARSPSSARSMSSTSSFSSSSRLSSPGSSSARSSASAKKSKLAWGASRGGAGGGGGEQRGSTGSEATRELELELDETHPAVQAAAQRLLEKALAAARDPSAAAAPAGVPGAPSSSSSPAIHASAAKLLERVRTNPAATAPMVKPSRPASAPRGGLAPPTTAPTATAAGGSDSARSVATGAASHRSVSSDLSMTSDASSTAMGNVLAHPTRIVPQRMGDIPVATLPPRKVFGPEGDTPSGSATPTTMSNAAPTRNMHSTPGVHVRASSTPSSVVSCGSTPRRRSSAVAPPMPPPPPPQLSIHTSSPSGSPPAPLSPMQDPKHVANMMAVIQAEVAALRAAAAVYEAKRAHPSATMTFQPTAPHVTTAPLPLQTNLAMDAAAPNSQYHPHVPPLRFAQPTPAAAAQARVAAGPLPPNPRAPLTTSQPRMDRLGADALPAGTPAGAVVSTPNRAPSGQLGAEAAYKQQLRRREATQPR